MKNDDNDNKDIYAGAADINDLDKGKLLEAVKGIQMKRGGKTAHHSCLLRESRRSGELWQKQIPDIRDKTRFQTCGIACIGCIHCPLHHRVQYFWNPHRSGSAKLRLIVRKPGFIREFLQHKPDCEFTGTHPDRGHHSEMVFTRRTGRKPVLPELPSRHNVPADAFIAVCLYQCTEGCYFQDRRAQKLQEFPVQRKDRGHRMHRPFHPGNPDSRRGHAGVRHDLFQRLRTKRRICAD